MSNNISGDLIELNNCGIEIDIKKSWESLPQDRILTLDFKWIIIFALWVLNNQKIFTSGIDISGTDSVYKCLGLFKDDDFDDKKEPKYGLIIVIRCGHVIILKNGR